MSYTKSLFVLVFAALAFAFSPAHAFLFGGSGTGGGDTGWGSRAVCPYGEFPSVVENALANPAAFLFNINFDCTEANGSRCPSTEEGIKAQLTAVDDGSGNLLGGFWFTGPSDPSCPNCIKRTDGGSFSADGFAPNMKIRVMIPDNSANDGDYSIQSVTADTIIVNEDLQDIGAVDNTFSGKVFSYLVDLKTFGQAPCYITDDDGVFLAGETPQPVAQFDYLIRYTKIDRECDDDGNCTGKAFETDPDHTITGAFAAADGAPLANHGCQAGFGCKVCVRNPDSLKNRDLDKYYGAVSPFEFGQSVLSAVDNSTGTPTYSFDARYPSSGPLVTSQVFSTPATTAQLEAAITSCANETVAFKIQGTNTDSQEDASGVVNVTGEFESETLNVASGQTTATVKFTYFPEPTFSCADIVSVKLEGVPSDGPVASLGNGSCRAQFNKTDVIDALRMQRSFVDGETRTLKSTGTFNTGSSGDQSFVSTDTVVITEQFNETVTFASATSMAQEGSDAQVTVQLAGGTPNGVVTVDVVDTRTGTARKKDYTFTPMTLTFDPADPDSFSQIVSFPIVADPNPDAGETIILQLTNLTGPASFGQIIQHTVTITEP